MTDSSHDIQPSCSTIDLRDARSGVHFASDGVIPLKAVCRLIPGRTGRGVALTTVFRWALRGCYGTRLETFRIGGQRYTTHEAIARFISAINARPSESLSNSRNQYQRNIEAGLEREGL